MAGFQGRQLRTPNEWRVRLLRFFFVASLVLIVGRLFLLQVVDAAWYRALSEGRHTIYEQLFPTRGSVYVKDFGDDTEYAVATNEPRGFVYADPREVVDPVTTALALAKILQLEGWDTYGVEEEETRDESQETSGETVVDPTAVITPDLVVPEPEPEPTETETLVARLSKTDDPYEPVTRDVRQDELAEIDAAQLPGIYYVLKDARNYPEKGIGGHVLGFLSRLSEEEVGTGQYGIEGFFDEFLRGRDGTLSSAVDAGGNWSGVGDRTFIPAVDGGDVLLTIDRTVQYIACQALAEGVRKYDADGGAVVIVEPATGRILAMCGNPDFDPNDYGNIDDVSVYNNPAIFEPYEPGSIIKPLTMAGALEVGAVTPNTTFEDTGEVLVDDHVIRNSDRKAHGLVTMTTVLDESLNTGMVWVMRKMGRDNLQKYFEDFGFGELTGIELNVEVPGTIANLDEAAELYAANASFGQGISLTPLQIVMAYAALANGGALMEPTIVDELRYPDGTIEHHRPKKLAQVVSEKTATTLGGMLVSVVENGHGKRAAVPGYYIAGKTGTAQVAGQGGYLAGVSNGSFAGFGPVGDPRFAMIVKLENPRAVEFAESSAAPLFGEIAEFLLRYYAVPPERP